MAARSHSAAVDRLDYATTNDSSPSQPPPQHLTHRHHDYGGNPLAHIHSIDSQGAASLRLPAFGGGLQPGLYKPPPFNFGNPVPLGLSGFALTTFLLSLINLGTMGVTNPIMVVGPAFAYGGFIQLLAGMWDIALGNTFGGTALSSYGGFWISIGIILTPGGFGIEDSYGPEANGNFYAAFGLYIFAWMIFTFLLWLLTLKSTVAFCTLFGSVWISFLCLGTAYLDAQNDPAGAPNVTLTRVGGGFGIAAGFIAWYNMLAGLADGSNTFFVIPVVHFPWSEKGRKDRGKIKDVESGESA
ncbi:Accumulation of DYads [Saxophila tyrrhenica]|uniref:Accumulation of DYads n=1 Tax=Saxophila tyrrhenica TaxID=1690608 RepID=A0AAV9NW88_9PEZI|nr:Accumulation of DYads [Saxophila tyrrhenica]